MALNAKNAPGGGMKIDPVDPGTYPAYVVQVIDLGLQPQPDYQGQKKDPAHKIMVTYEFADEFLKDEDGQDQEDKPRWLSETFALYNLESEKAKSTARYLAIDPTKKHDGNWPDLLGTPVFVTIVHNEKKGKVYENIASVAPMREKDVKRFTGPVNEPKFFDLDEPDMEVFLALPKWVKELVQANLNFEGSKLQKLLKSGGEPEKKQETSASEDLEDENPY